MLLFCNSKLCNHLLRTSLNQIKLQRTLTPIIRYHIFTKSKITSKCDKRSIYDWFRKPSESEYRFKDKIAPDYKLVYNTTMDKYLLLGQLVTGILGGTLGVAAVLTGDVKFPKPNEPQQLEMNGEFILYATALIVCVVAIQRIIAKVPIRIYKSEITKQYVFVKRGVLPFSKKYFTCTANQLRKVEGGTPIIPWNDNTYKLVQKHDERIMVLLEHCFKRPADLNILLGYQKEDE